jgi:hypothetical protein
VKKTGQNHLKFNTPVCNWGVKFVAILWLIFHPIFGPKVEIRFFEKACRLFVPRELIEGSDFFNFVAVR